MDLTAAETTFVHVTDTIDAAAASSVRGVVRKGCVGVATDDLSRRHLDGDDARWGVLGGVWVSVGGAVLNLSPQSRFVLGSLLMNPGRIVSAERLALGAATDKAVNSARVAVSRLRSALAPFGARECIVTSPTGYAIEVDPWAVDHVVFTHVVRQAETPGEDSAKLRALESALEMWKGEPFGELRSDPPFHAFALALEEQRRAAIDLWAELAVRAETSTALVTELELAVSEEPLRERRWAALMLAHYRCGNQSAAVRTYERARAALRDELGLDPGPELRRLLTAILDHEPSLEWRPARSRPRAEGPGPLVGPAALIGRETEISDLLSLLERRRAVVLVGVGGVGKSSLAAEVVPAADRHAWVVSLVGVESDDRLAHVVGQAIGIAMLPGVDPIAAIAARLQEHAGLLVLDNCEHIPDQCAALVSQLMAAAPDARILATSRVELPLTGAITFTLGPLPTGNRTAPGAAAIIAADAARIRPSTIADNWDILEEICRRADGIPLALELLGSSWADGRAAPPEGAAAVEGAVQVAIDCLPAESRRLVEMLASLPSEVGTAWLNRLSVLETAPLARALGPALRAGLLVQRTDTVGTRVRVLEPVREVLSVDASLVDQVVQGLRRLVSELAALACPQMLGTIHTEPAVLLDDEHEIVLWMFGQLGAHDRLELACALAPVWGATGRTLDGTDQLEQVKATALAGDDLVQARYWVSRVVVSPAMSDRARFVEQLRWAMGVADRAGDDDLFGRAGGELVAGLGWSGETEEAGKVLCVLRERVPEDNPWAGTTLAGLTSLARAMNGDPSTAADELIGLSRAYREIGHPGEVASKLFLAATLARIAGDEQQLCRALDEARDLRPDRFCGYTLAGLALERAKLAAAASEPDAGRLLAQAHDLLGAFGEQRMAAMCRREIGIWRLSNGDAEGSVDLAAAARQLLRLDPPAAAVAVAHLAAAAGDDRAPTEVEVLSRAIGKLMNEPGGTPLSGPELALVQSHAAAPGVTPELDDIADLLRSVEANDSLRAS